MTLLNGREDIFSEKCYHTYYSLMNTSVRVLNQLINKSLILAMSRKKITVDSEIIMDASSELMIGL